MLKTQADMHRVLAHQKSGLLHFVWKNFLCCCGRVEDRWEFERAPEPSDIAWENMMYTWCDRFCRGIVSLAATLVLIVGSFLAIYFIKTW